MSDSHASQLETPFSAEPSPSWRSRFLTLSGLVLALSIIGAGVAGYLTYVHYDESVLVCTASGGCHTVQQSEYATIGPIPIAILGLGMFLTLAALALIRIFDWSLLSADTATMLAWGMTLSALLYYAYLVYVEVFILEAICQWCVGTTALTIAIFAIESIKLRAAMAIDVDEWVD